MPFRSLALTAVVLALGAMGAAWMLLTFIWDGAYQVAASLEAGRPFVYGWRFHTALLWWPGVWAGAVTDHPVAISMAFGLPFLLAPALAVVTAWWLVRPARPELAVWAAVGVAVALPGQVFAINDSVWQQTWFWPVLVGGMVPLAGARRWVWIALLGAQFPHQIGAVLLACAALGAWVSGRAWQRRALCVATALAGVKALATVQPWVPALQDPWALEEAAPDRLWSSFLNGLAGYPMGALAGVIAAALGLVAPLRGRLRLALVAGGMAAFALASGLWAADGELWLYALDYRRWVVPCAVPFAALAVWDGRRGRGASPRLRGAVACGVALVWAAVLLVQSREWNETLRRAESALGMDRGAIPEGRLDAFARTPLAHWSAPSAWVLLQGRTVEWFGAGENGEPVLAPWHPVGGEPGPLGYFRIENAERR